MSTPNTLLESIFVDPDLNNLIEDLTFNELFNKHLNLSRKPIDHKRIRKSIWLSSILANSESDEHRNKVQILASLLYLQFPGDMEIGRAIYVLFSRLGNLTGTSLFSEENINFKSLSFLGETDIDAFDPSLMLELQTERNHKTISISETDSMTVTRFQRMLWDELNRNNRLIISAPTSSGKSFIIKKHLKSILSVAESLTAVYIVPSRALLNQASEDLRREFDLNKVSIKTVFINDSDEAAHKHQVFILTPERCLRLLKLNSEGKISIDFIFIDEIQNVEDTQGRGALFEFVFKELFTLFPEAKLIAAGPNIENSRNLFSTVFGPGGESIDTLASPVFQIKTTIRPLPDKKLEITASTLKNFNQKYTVSTEADIYRKFQTNTGEGLKDLIVLFGKSQQNIIYSPKGNWAADWAISFAGSLDEIERKDNWILEIIDFLAEEIHPLYSLIPCLSKGVAYHHGNLPDIVRKEIEDCFLEGKIRHLFCTSTLLQGVNLPANNLFIPMPKKRNLNLTPFDFGNLIGRAGRIRDSLYGSIYCIERKSDEEWSQDMYTKSYQKKVQTASEKALERLEDFIDYLNKPANEIQFESDSSAVVFFRQKIIMDPMKFRDSLVKSNLTEEEINIVESKLRESVRNLEVPVELLKLNPTIDPILQDELFKRIKLLGIENWLIPSRTENRNMFRFQTIEDKTQLEFKEQSFYWQLIDVIERLNDIFHLAEESFWNHSISISIKQICFYARQWLNGKSLRQLIDSDIKFHSTHINPKKRIDVQNMVDVNSRINSVIKVNSVVTTHILIKYMKLLNDLSESFLNDELKEQYKFALALPTMLELGTTEPEVATLISRGISRSIALKIFSEFRKIFDYENLDILRWLSSKEKLNLKPIYNRYLKRMRLLKEKTDG